MLFSFFKYLVLWAVREWGVCVRGGEGRVRRGGKRAKNDPK